MAKISKEGGGQILGVKSAIAPKLIEPSVSAPRAVMEGIGG
jgi:hypothetical protein